MQMGQGFSRNFLAKLGALVGLQALAHRTEFEPEHKPHKGHGRIGHTAKQTSGTWAAKRKHLRQISRASRIRNRAA